MTDAEYFAPQKWRATRAPRDQVTVAPAGRVAFVFGAPLGAGGLGLQSLNAFRALGRGAHSIEAIGPESAPPVEGWSSRVTLHAVARPAQGPRVVDWANRRWRSGAMQLDRDRAIGGAALARLRSQPPQICYAFTQVALEPLLWSRERGIPTVLDSPNGHIRNFRRVYQEECARWCRGTTYSGHPTNDMVERVEREYALADRIRVSSEFARQSLVNGGVDERKVFLVRQPIDLVRFRCVERALSPRMHICFVGQLDLRKGFPYLLEAFAQTRDLPIDLHLVGATGDRCSHRLLSLLARDLPVTIAAGDPLPVLARSEVLILPTLEDGFGFVVAEALASGLPVITTTAAGAAECVRHGETGWIVPPRSSSALAGALRQAWTSRRLFRGMGLAGRADAERLLGPECDRQLHDWVVSVL